MSDKKLSRQGKFTDYDGFVEKFDPKKTTDDCYTPDVVFDVIADHVCAQYGYERSAIVRPFWPGGDFEAFDYPPGCLVLDNPPFSIITKIVRTYNAAGIKYYLFGPHLTLSGIPCPTAVVAGVDITYANGATVKTSFATNLPDEFVVRNDPALTRAVHEAQKEARMAAKPPRPLRMYDRHIFKFTDMDPLTRNGVSFGLRAGECMKVSGAGGTDAYGKWLILSTAAAERAAAERAAAERAAAERAAEWVRLGPQEKAIVELLDNGAQLTIDPAA